MTSVRSRGITSVLAMMFLVIFGSLSVAMAIMAQGNLRAADSALHVSRATSAAQTGLVFAVRRLDAEGRRWVVQEGLITEEYGEALWSGEIETIDEDVVLLPPDGYTTSSDPAGLMESVMDAHLADEHAFDAEPGDNQLPIIIDGARLETKPIRMRASKNDFYFRLRYEVIDSDSDESRIRVTSEGVDGDITRQVAMDFLITKKIPYAAVSPNRIMIGKNVIVEGPLGTRFGINPGELNEGNGDPMVIRSDFRYLDDTLNEQINLLNQSIAEYDVDGDGRLRPTHPTESIPIVSNEALLDVDGDQYVTGFDLFLNHFDMNGDGRVVWDAERAEDAGLGTLTEEFRDVDNQLARLLDRAFEDRNLDGYVDMTDVALGYNDGVLDEFDMYAKVRGNLAFGISEAAWNTANGAPWRSVVEGAVVAPTDQAPVIFEAPESLLRDVTTTMFSENQEWYTNQTGSSSSFESQVEENLADSSQAEYVEASSSEWESVPEGSPNPYDWYRRPVYRNMVFTDVLIPKGINGRFENCTFIGTTYVETEVECENPNWNYLGAIERIEDEAQNVSYELKFPGIDPAETPDGSGTISDTKTWSNNLVFNDCTVLGAIAGDRPGEYTHWRNKLQFTGATRFYLDPLDPELEAQSDSDEIISILESFSDDQADHFSRSMMMMPGWSVDVGNFSNEQADDWEATPVVNLRGVIIAGVLDARGTVDVHGTLLMTFRPVEGSGPLFYGGSADQFNTTLGYFGALDGDLEGPDPTGEDFEGFGEIVLRYDPDVRLPDGIPWPITVAPLPETYTEGASNQ
ncbi:MAG: hypothetical protein MK082_10505 [Phycisphaerales bacterium]|nr:hypothetical protein [Phycisphaerales bacterium]